LEILEEMAEEQGKVVNQEEFRQEFEKHQEISRIGQEKNSVVMELIRLQMNKIKLKLPNFIPLLIYY